MKVESDRSINEAGLSEAARKIVNELGFVENSTHQLSLVNELVGLDLQTEQLEDGRPLSLKTTLYLEKCKRTSESLRLPMAEVINATVKELRRRLEIMHDESSDND
jgi:hypothetical protein